MCDMIDSQSAEKISRMKKLRRTLSESFGRIALKKEDSSFDEDERPTLRFLKKIQPTLDKLIVFQHVYHTAQLHFVITR